VEGNLACKLVRLENSRILLRMMFGNFISIAFSNSNRRQLAETLLLC
jgi:hypothetical protein